MRSVQFGPVLGLLGALAAGCSDAGGDDSSPAQLAPTGPLPATGGVPATGGAASGGGPATVLGGSGGAAPAGGAAGALPAGSGGLQTGPAGAGGSSAGGEAGGRPGTGGSAGSAAAGQPGAAGAAGSAPIEPPPAVPADAVLIRTTDDAADVVGAHPEGTAFRFENGTHTNVSIRPKRGQTFWGDPDGGVVLDGRGSTDQAFTSNKQIADVGVYYLELINYAPRDYHAVVNCYTQSWNDEEWKPRLDWTIYGVDIHDMHGAPESSAVKMGSGCTLRQSRLHDLDGSGIRGTGRFLTVDGVEVANVQSEHTGWSTGPIKLVVVTDTVIRNSHIHDNEGNGIWLDINCSEITIENNLVERNTDAGIFYEISRNAVIRGNTLRGNSTQDWDRPAHWVHYSAGIFIATSHNVVVEDNTLEGNIRAIWATDQWRKRDPHRDGSLERPAEEWGVPDTSSPVFGRMEEGAHGGHLTIRNNTIIDSGQVGATADGEWSPDSIIYSTTTFTGNSYEQTPAWRWKPVGGDADDRSVEYDFAGWQSFGHDL